MVYRKPLIELANLVPNKLIQNSFRVPNHSDGPVDSGESLVPGCSKTFSNLNNDHPNFRSKFLDCKV